jgi:tight adherence protein C
MRSRLSGDGLGNADEQVISRAIQILMVLAGIVVAVPVARALGVSVFLAGLCGGTIAYLVPDYFVQRRRLQKRMKITRELPAMLDLLVVTLEAGLGLSEAIRLVGRQSERQGSVLGKELSTVAAELGAGVILANAMKALGERTGVDEIKSLSAVFDSE